MPFPGVPRYRLISRPSYLDFRGKRVRFYFHRVEGYTWHFRAIADPDHRSLVIYEALHQEVFERELLEGFDVTAAPAVRTMTVLVREGYAAEVV